MVAFCKRAQERGSNSKRKTNEGIKTSCVIKVEAKGHRQGENQAREQAKVKRYQTVINERQSRNKKHKHTCTQQPQRPPGMDVNRCVV